MTETRDRPRISKRMSGIRLLILLLVGLLLVRGSMFDWVDVPSSSMYPTFLIGDRLLLNRMAYDIKFPFSGAVLWRLSNPKHGELVTFTSPADGLHLVKRIIGVPGDVVQMREGQLTLNGLPAIYLAADSEGIHFAPDYAGPQIAQIERLAGSQTFIITMPGRKVVRSFGPITVPENTYLVLGDNRDNSNDSRYLGFIRRDAMIGRVTGVVFSLDAGRAYRPRMERMGMAVR